eukprot:scaffold40902_cov68-Phaeocystis_antarctica.AAC.3
MHTSSARCVASASSAASSVGWLPPPPGSAAPTSRGEIETAALSRGARPLVITPPESSSFELRGERRRPPAASASRAAVRCEQRAEGATCQRTAESSWLSSLGGGGGGAPSPPAAVTLRRMRCSGGTGAEAATEADSAAGGSCGGGGGGAEMPISRSAMISNISRCDAKCAAAPRRSPRMRSASPSFPSVSATSACAALPP